MNTKTALRLGIADHGVKLTREEFGEAQYEERWRYERVNGRLVVMTRALAENQISINRVRDYLGEYALARPEIVDYVFSEAWVGTTKTNDRIADIGVFLVSDKKTRTIPDRVPDLVFQNVSGGVADMKRNYVELRREFLRAGVSEYVLIDAFYSLMTVVHKVRGRFTQSRFGANATYATRLLPGLQIPLKALL